MKAIIISGMPATGKTEAARILSERLGIPMMGGGDILKEMARERGYHPTGDDWWDTEEGMRFVSERQKDPNFDKEADRRMEEKVKKGNIILTSYTAPWLFKDGIKIWLNATPETRAKRMAKRDNIDMGKAKEAIAFRDKGNSDIYSKMYNIKLGSDKKPFDIIIDTDNITAEQVADAIMQKLKELHFIK